MKENQREEIRNLLDAGRKKIDRDGKEREIALEAIRVELEKVTRENVDIYKREYWEEIDKAYDSYSKSIRPFWEKLIRRGGVIDRLVKAGYVDYGYSARIVDPILYKWPRFAQRSLEVGGRFPELKPKWVRDLGPRPCIFDAYELLEPAIPTRDPDFWVKNTLACYRDDDGNQGEVCLEQYGFAIYRMPPKGHSWGRYDYECFSYRIDFRRIKNNLPYIPEFIHPKVINGFASQVKSGRCDEYIGELLIKARGRR